MGVTGLEALAMLALPKRGVHPMVWTERNNHVGHQHCASVLTDARGITLPGLTVVFEVKAPVVVTACSFDFTIYQLSRAGRRRAYQLAECPATKRSHQSPGIVIYGPHEHVGNDVASVNDPAVTCADWAACYAWFLRQCTLEPLTVDPPC